MAFALRAVMRNRQMDEDGKTTEAMFQQRSRRPF